MNERPLSNGNAGKSTLLTRFCWTLVAGSFLMILPMAGIGCNNKPAPPKGGVVTGDTVKVGILHSLSGTMAISETLAFEGR